jgi:RNA polymerase sigma-70 factor (ECF subfamily)
MALPAGATRSGAGEGGDCVLAAMAERYRTSLNVFFRRRVDPPQDAEDLTQEVLLRLAARRDGEDVHSVQRYIFQTAGSVLTDHYRRRAARGLGLIDSYCEESHAQADISPEQILLGREAVERMQRSIASLPERTRQALLLFRFEGKRQAEIARHMNISVSAVEKLVKRGMIAIAAAIADGD